MRRVHPGDSAPERWVEAYEKSIGPIARRGSEWVGPCPVCGGEDRFHISRGTVRATVSGCRGGCSFETIVDRLFGSERADIPVTTVLPARKPKPTKEDYQTPPSPYNNEEGPFDLDDLAELWPYHLDSATVYRFPVLPLGSGEVHQVKFRNKLGKKRRTFCRPTGWGLFRGYKEEIYFRSKQDGCWRQVDAKTPPGVERKHISAAQVDLYRPGSVDIAPHQRPDVVSQARDSGDWLLLVEGPSDAEKATELGELATCNACGANGISKEEAVPLKGVRVAVIGDNDDPGRRGIDKRARLAYEAGALEVRVLEPWGDRDSSHDLSDWVDALRKNGVNARTIRAELHRQIESSPRWTPKTRTQRPLTGELSYQMTDRRNAERFRDRVGPRFKYSEKLKTWMYWNGRRYAEDWKNAALDAACYSAKEIYAEAHKVRMQAKNAPSEDEKEALENFAEKLHGWGSRSLNANKVDAALHLAKGLPEIAVEPSEFDQDSFSLNTLGGLLNLKTKEFHSHPEISHYSVDQQESEPDQELPMVSKVAGVRYDPKAECLRWQQAARQMFVHPRNHCHAGKPDVSLIRYVQKLFGLSLTGCIDEQILIFCHGTGANGKTIVLDILRKLGGNYAHILNMSTLRQYKMDVPNQNQPEIADLQGKRIAIATEAGVSSRWSEEVVKKLTGGDPISAARKYANPIEFNPTHKLWVAANHPPSTYDNSEGFWRRVKLIPFYSTFRHSHELDRSDPMQKERDNDLKKSLEAELSGILNWALEGLQLYLAEGLGDCEAVQRATTRYRKEQDRLGDFFDDRVTIEDEAQVFNGELRQAYEDWCQDSGEAPLSSTVFGRILTERGFLKRSARNPVTGKPDKVRVGLRLRRPDETEPDKTLKDRSKSDYSDRHEMAVQDHDQLASGANATSSVSGDITFSTLMDEAEERMELEYDTIPQTWTNWARILAETIAKYEGELTDDHLKCARRAMEQAEENAAAEKDGPPNPGLTEALFPPEDLDSGDRLADFERKLSWRMQT